MGDGGGLSFSTGHVGQVARASHLSQRLGHCKERLFMSHSTRNTLVCVFFVDVLA